MQVFWIQTSQANKYHVLKAFTFPGGLRRQEALQLSKGEVHTCLWRDAGSWAQKKAVQLLLDRLPGIHAKCIHVPQKRANAPMGEHNAKWNPSREELHQGISYINAAVEHMDPQDGENELLEWVTAEVRDPGSKIFGWPTTFVEKATKNRVSRNGGATRQFFYPLVARKDLKPVISNHVLPLIVPWLRIYGMIICGWPGRGKTQFGKMIALMMGRYWISVKQATGKVPSWRRGKKIERFQKMIQEQWETLLLDDPQLETIGYEDVKAFLELRDAGSGDGRYNDAKYCLNALRCLLTSGRRPSGSSTEPLSAAQ